MIILEFVPLPARRLLATVAALWFIAVAAAGASADEIPDSTWVALASLPSQARSPIFGLAVDPSNNQSVFAGNSQGAILHSANGGATWVTSHTGTAPVGTIAFSPFKGGLVLAGTRGEGALESGDGGATWHPVNGLNGRSVLVFGFALTTMFAGTDRGVYASTDGVTWTQSGLGGSNIDAIAVEAIHDPIRLLAGGDSQGAGSSLVLYQSVDAAATWTQLTPAINGTIATSMVSGPLPPTGNVRPLLVCTNTGLFASADNGTSFNPLSGGNLLPSTDFIAATFITDHYNRFYAASDGGGGAGGLWRSDDGGTNFRSLDPPQPSVTALAVSNDESPTLYVATFRPSDHRPFLWTYHDTGAPPQQPPASPAASGSRVRPPSAPASRLQDLLALPQLPYIALGIGALAVILTAAIVHLRSRYR